MIQRRGILGFKLKASAQRLVDEKFAPQEFDRDILLQRELRRTVDVGLNDAVEVIGPDNRPRIGRVATLDDDYLVIEVLDGSLADVTVKCGDLLGPSLPDVLHRHTQEVRHRDARNHRPADPFADRRR